MMVRVRDTYEDCIMCIRQEAVTCIALVNEGDYQVYLSSGDHSIHVNQKHAIMLGWVLKSKAKDK